MDDESPGSQLLPVLAQLVRFLRQLEGPDNPSSIALSVLRRLADAGPGRVTDLARLTRASQPGMTQLVGRMEKSGLVQRVPDPNDGRGVLVEVTSAGRELLARTYANYAATLDRLFDRLDPGDSETILRALPALGRLAAAGEKGDTTVDLDGAGGA
ncbi:DNA-binding MarR family transcriptional regulator [Actinoplanes octamycinicus]|uniref:DNA-binding MarR family transcriptional regulator n=1 Tax=Actinoplanes octamycinicus TaxID=135948 RepID=A0A7W7H482_9ACTN|nr:MarR family transcriptional regulator [Actinoplanes octamycinicus]MBB4743691.1 DNA-binding MarR family transcriptional regulator [Actinoplanes octamycinicus]GIE61120.1 MarR family transcriptional regulator [Actinoplanes octamycinicus]